MSIRKIRELRTIMTYRENISQIQIQPIHPRGGHVAFCSFVLFDSLYCSGIAIFTRPLGGYRLVFPTRIYKGVQSALFYPIRKRFGEFIEKEVTRYIKEVMKDDRYNSPKNSISSF